MRNQPESEVDGHTTASRPLRREAIPVWDRPRTLAELEQPGVTREVFWRLADARVVIADYRLILQDHPWLVEGTAREDARDAANQWLLNHAAVTSEAQAAQRAVNSQIRVRPERVEGLRPTGYGRAAILAAPKPNKGSTTAEIVDVKGVGVRPGAVPVPGRHRNGLLSLHRALYEFLMHRLVSECLGHAGAAHRVLGIYAVLDTGFDVLEPGAVRPAGILVRRPHYRQEDGVDLPKAASAMQIAVAEAELILRQYGVTSASPEPGLCLHQSSRGLRLLREGIVEEGHSQEALAALHAHVGGGPRLAFDVINVQAARELDWARGAAELVDLGHYTVRERFDHPLVSAVCDRPFGWGGRIEPDQPEFVQPLPSIQCDPRIWCARKVPVLHASRLRLSEGTHLSAAMIACMYLAGRARYDDPETISRKLNALVRATVRRWPRRPRTLHDTDKLV